MRSGWRKCISRDRGVSPALSRRLMPRAQGRWALGGLAALALAPVPALAQQTAPDPAKQDQQRPAPTVVDPVTGRPVDRAGAATDIVDRAVADRYHDVPYRADGQPEGTVRSYIPLPPVSTANASLTDPIRRDRALTERRLPGLTVRERRRPEYDAVGFEAGGMKIVPYAMAGTAVDSNVYAERNGRSDVLFTGTAGLDVQSQWGRHEVELTGHVRHREYATFNSEDATTYRVNARGRLDLAGQNTVSAQVLREEQVLDRGIADEVVNLAFPTKFGRWLGEIATHVEYGQLELDLTGSATRERYDDNRTVAGAFVDQRFRNHDVLGVDVAVGFDIGGLRSIYGEFGYDRRRFDFQAGGIDRDANVYRFMGGFRGGITRLVRGHIAAGYMNVDFLQTGVSSLKTFAIDAELDWLFSQRTTFSLTAKRDLRTVSQNNARGTILTRIAAQADHELRRNLILTLTAQQQWTDYVNDPRRATATGVALGAIWLLDRHWQVRPQIGYLRRWDNGFLVDASPEDFSAGVDVTFRF